MSDRPCWDPKQHQDGWYGRGLMKPWPRGGRCYAEVSRRCRGAQQQVCWAAHARFNAMNSSLVFVTRGFGKTRVVARMIPLRRECSGMERIAALSAEGNHPRHNARFPKSTGDEDQG